MKIAYLTGQYPRATDTFIQREVAILRELGATIETFSVRRPGAEHRVGAEQIAEYDRTHYLLPFNPFRLFFAHSRLFWQAPDRYCKALRLAWSTRAPGLGQTLYQLFYFAEAGLLAREIQKRRIAHLHNHLADSSCTVAMLAAALGGFPFSFTIHGPSIFFEPYRWRIDAKIQQALFVCCISHFCRSQCMLFVHPRYWSRLHIVHCGVDPDQFAAQTPPVSSKRLLYVGRLAAAKGLPILWQAMVSLKHKHPDIQLKIIGDGPDRVALEQQALDLNLQENLQFLGYQSQTVVREQLRETDVFVLPSFAEGVPVSLMEAMAASVPVVTTQIAGIGELVESGVSGFLVPPGDVESLVDRINTLLANPKLRYQLGQKGRAKVREAFNLRQEVTHLLQLFQTYK
jgi:glycosyltransferase involved in cell wall biosynthesis